MCHPVGDEHVRQDDLRAVDPGRPIIADRKRKITALQCRCCIVAQRWRKNDILGDEVIIQDRLEGSDVRWRKHRGDVFESLVLRDEEGEVREIIRLRFRTFETQITCERRTSMLLPLHRAWGIVPIM